MPAKTECTTVAIVGAGISGLIAARDLRRRGVDVLVFEAADRVGGRMLAESTALGSRVDLGGQWIGHDHHRFTALADELGVTRYRMHTPRRPVIADGERVITGWSPAMIAANIALAGTEALARVPLQKRWNATPLRAWLDRIPSDRARRLLELLVELSSCAGPDEQSIGAFLAMVRHEGGLATMLKTRGGAQDSLIVEGAATLTERLAAELDERVRTGCRVSEIQQDHDGVSITTAAGQIRAHKAVVSVPPPMTRDITFAAGLPAERVGLQHNTFMGSVYKAIAVYDTPFWRATTDAEAVVLGSPGFAVFDTSAPGGPGHLCILVGGPHATAIDELGRDERQSALLSLLASRLGPKVLRPASWHDKSWHRDVFAGGGYTALPALGTRDGFYPFTCAPSGHIHWAGAETASAHAGYIEGAIESGERAAAEIASALGRQSG